MPDAQLCKLMMAPLISLDPSDIEIKNREYYRGRVVSTINGVKIYSWEDWPLEA
jgi:hypothetical protein